MRYQDEKQVAATLSCTVSALRRWRLEGKGPKLTKIGKLVRYREDWVWDFAEANTVEPINTTEPTTVETQILEVCNV